MAATEGASTTLTPEDLEAKLKEGLSTTFVQVRDSSADPARCGSAFEAIIVSPEFEGKATLARHRMVNKLLAKELETIHAFSQKTMSPAEFEALQGGA